MNAQQLFSYANLFALAGWLALLLAPVRRSLMVAAARWVSAVLAGGYVSLLLFSLARGGGGPAPDFSSLASLAALFGRPEVLLVGWLHYLAFDLWVGSWMAGDAERARVSHALVVPCLALTFLAGPCGLLLYLLIRAGRRRRA